MNLACSRHAPVVPVPGKVVKIRPKLFSTVLTGNDKNNTTNCVGMFRVHNRVILARFSTLPAPMVLGPEKVVKIRPKHFSVVLKANDKKCTSNCVLVQNQVIRPRSSTLPTSGLLWVARAQKSRQNSTEIFFKRTDMKR